MSIQRSVTCLNPRSGCLLLSRVLQESYPISNYTANTFKSKYLASNFQLYKGGIHEYEEHDSDCMKALRFKIHPL